MTPPAEWREPTFPALIWDKIHWTATIRLDAWPAAPTVLGTAGMPACYAPKDDAIILMVDSPTGEDEVPPAAWQVEAYRRLTAEAVAIRDSLLRAVFAEYPDLREMALEEFEEDEAAILLPVARTPLDLMPLIHLSGIRILPVQHAGLAYTGYSFGCTWDWEHKLGVMMHWDRVVEVGGADVPLLEWIARRDADAAAINA